MLKAIETRYKGYRFRSRLEARWAVVFDNLGIQWEYEKEGYDLSTLGWYLPDFWFTHLNTWVEIKGKQPSHVEREKIKILATETNSQALLIAGTPGQATLFYTDTLHFFDQAPQGSYHIWHSMCGCSQQKLEAAYGAGLFASF